MTKRRERKKQRTYTFISKRGEHFQWYWFYYVFTSAKLFFSVLYILCRSLIKKNRIHKKAHTHTYIHADTQWITREWEWEWERYKYWIRTIRGKIPALRQAAYTRRPYDAYDLFVCIWKTTNAVKHGLIHSVFFCFFILLLTKKKTESKIYRKIQTDTHTHSYKYLYKYI